MSVGQTACPVMITKSSQTDKHSAWKWLLPSHPLALTVVCKCVCVYALPPLSYPLHIISKFDPILLNLSHKWRSLSATLGSTYKSSLRRKITIQTRTVSSLFVGGGGGGRQRRAFYRWAAAWLYSLDPAVGDYLFYEPIFLLLGFLLLIEGAAGLSW